MSARIDRSNLFGAKTNKKTVPLGSMGMKWDLSEEKFYPFKKQIPYLSFRSSLGLSGNIDPAASALISALPTQTSMGTIYSVISPANPNLRWEKSRMFNFGF